MRRTIPFCSKAAMIAIAASALASQRIDAPIPDRITVQLEKVNGIEAVKRICRAARVDYAMGPGFLAAAKRVNITTTYNQISLTGVLDHLVKTVDERAAYSTLGGVYSFTAPGDSSKLPRMGPDSLPDRRLIPVTMQMGNVPLDRALSNLMRLTDAAYAIRKVASRKNITLTFSNAPFESALQGVLQSADVELRHDGNANLFIIPISPGRLPVIDLNTTRVSLRVDEYDLRYALKALFGTVAASYTLAPNVRGVVSARMDDVPFRTAMDVLLRVGAEVALTYRVEDGVFIIRPMSEDSHIGEIRDSQNSLLPS